jgi:hypothetical protein
MSEALPGSGVDRDALLAERAEAEAQLQAAEATLGNSPTNTNGITDDKQERKEPVQKPLNVEVQDDPVEELDVAALQQAAARARLADDELAMAASEAADAPDGSGVRLGTAEGAFARVLEIREELPATWRRLVGALISATGMAIVVGALGWNVYWLLVPIALIAILTVDLRLAGKAIQEASTEAAHELAAVGVSGTEALDRIRSHRARTDDVEGRLAAARAEREAAYDRFDELAPGRLPSELDEIIAEYEAEQAARAQARAEFEAARAEAEAEAEAARAQAEVEAEEAAAQAEVEEEAEEVPVEPAATTLEVDVADEPEADEPAAAEEPAGPVTASEWWFGSTEAPEAPATAAAPVRALAERLSAEGREALARIQAQLDALDRVELAKKSLEWHEANGAAEPADTTQQKP